MTAGKYTPNPSCDWGCDLPAKEYVIETRGTKLKRYKITVMACSDCARRLQLADE